MGRTGDNWTFFNMTVSLISLEKTKRKKKRLIDKIIFWHTPTKQHITLLGKTFLPSIGLTTDITYERVKYQIPESHDVFSSCKFV